ARAPTAAVITTTPTLWCAAATVSCRSTSTCPAARRRRKRCCTASSSCRTRSSVPTLLPGNPMTTRLEQLEENLKRAFGDSLTRLTVELGEITIECKPGELLAVCATMRDHPELRFEQL